MSDCDGTGVADTVVVILAVETGPMKMSQKSLTLMLRFVANAVGLAMGVLETVVVFAIDD